MDYNLVVPKEWNEYVTQKYIEFRGDKIGREGSVAAFSRWLGINQTQVTRMMEPGGQRPTSHKIINAFIAKYGQEDVFSALGLPGPIGSESFVSYEPMTREEAIQLIRDLAFRFDIPVEIHRVDPKRKREEPH